MRLFDSAVAARYQREHASPGDTIAVLLVLAALATAILYLLFAILITTANAQPVETGGADGGSMYAPPRAQAPLTLPSPREKRGEGQKGNSVSLAGVVAPLAAKARAIVALCGAKVVSAVRRGARVYGGSASNHASGRAVDLQGNPTCIYAQLADWPGGVTTDYWRAPGGPHVHVSFNPPCADPQRAGARGCGMEWGRRFAHPRGKKSAAKARRSSNNRRGIE